MEATISDAAYVEVKRQQPRSLHTDTTLPADLLPARVSFPWPGYVLSASLESYFAYRVSCPCAVSVLKYGPGFPVVSQRSS